MALSKTMLNRIGFILLGLTNNFAYVIMLSAAFDLLKQTDKQAGGGSDGGAIIPIKLMTSTAINLPNLTTAIVNSGAKNNTSPDEPFCNQHSTSTVLLADSLPSLSTKLIYPFLLVGLPTYSKAIATALLSTASFLITGLSSNKYLIFLGIACASFSTGLGETTYLSNSPQYGMVAISGWSAGTGVSGLLGSICYALLRAYLPIKIIMIVMLVAPILMLVTYFFIIKPVDVTEVGSGSSESIRNYYQPRKKHSISVSVISSSSEENQKKPIWSNLKGLATHSYGIHNLDAAKPGATHKNSQLHLQQPTSPLFQPLDIQLTQNTETSTFDYKAKLRFLPTLFKYFGPLFLVYYAEFFINQGLHELIYYPEISRLDHAAQYRWLQVIYQFGVMISRSSLDFLVIRYLWSMSLLQVVNAIIFLLHVSQLIHISSFYIVIIITVYEGLLGGFTYANTFYRMRQELPTNRQAFGISTVVIADTLGIVLAGSTAIPVHDSLCKLYV